MRFTDIKVSIFSEYDADQHSTSFSSETNRTPGIVNLEFSFAWPGKQLGLKFRRFGLSSRHPFLRRIMVEIAHMIGGREVFFSLVRNDAEKQIRYVDFVFCGWHW